LNILDIVKRSPAPQPFGDQPNLPWNEAEFSKRMLKEHLNQAHNAASRRTEIIEHHVNWIHENCLSENKGNILDLTCGPGLYGNRFAKMGHHYRGIDFSPASIEYAKSQAERDALSIDYVEGSVLESDYGENYDLAMMLSGQFNTFSAEDSRAILENAYAALRAGGMLLLEPQTIDSIQRIGNLPPRWFTGENNLYAVSPHLAIKEHHWHEEQQATTERYFIIEAASGEASYFVISMQAYTQSALRELL